MLVSLLEPDEYEALGIAGLADAAEKAGISVVHLPIPDVGVPASIRTNVEFCAGRVFCLPLASRVSARDRRVVELLYNHRSPTT